MLNTCAGRHRHETDTRHFMHVTALGAMEPAARVDDRVRAGVVPGTRDSAIVLSGFLRREIGPGGARYEDFTTLLQTSHQALRNRGPARVRKVTE